MKPIKPTRHAPLWYRLFRRFLRVAAPVLFKLWIEGIEHVPRGNYVVIANHLSWVDPFLLMMALPPEPRLYFVGAQQALNQGWKAWLIHRIDVMIPFERGAAWIGKDMFKKSLEVLRGGAVLGIFPEGNLGPKEGELQPLKRGIGHLVLNADCQILPVALGGVQELYLRKPVTIHIGKPFRIAADGLDHHAQVDAAVDCVTVTLRALLSPYAGHKPRVKLFRRLTNLLD